MSLEFSSLTAESAPTAARGMLSASEQRFGFLPSPVARGAHAPGVLKHLLQSFAAYDQTSLSEIEREVIAMTVAFEHRCHYCMAMHSAMQAQHAEIVAALRAGSTLPVPKLEALRAYAKALVVHKGSVPVEIADAFAAHYRAEQALEVVLGVATYTLSTFLNIVTDAPLDAPFAAYAWHPPVS